VWFACVSAQRGRKRWDGFKGGKQRCRPAAGVSRKQGGPSLREAAAVPIMCLPAPPLPLVHPNIITRLIVLHSLVLVLSCVL
jgi:hypothetical protein